MLITLAKNKPHEFQIEIPFASKKQFRKAYSNFKTRYFPDLTGKNCPCWEFYNQFLSAEIINKGIEYIKPNKSYTKDFYIKKYGAEKGELLWNERISNDKVKNTLEGFIKRYGKEDGTRKYYEKNSKLSVSLTALEKNGYSPEEIQQIKEKHSKNSAISLESHKEKYGDELGELLYDKYINENHVSPRTVKYWLNKGYSNEEAVVKISEFQTRNLNSMVAKYGLEEGTLKYKQWNTDKNTKIRVSKASIKLFKQLYKKLRKLGIKREEIKWGISGSKEFNLWSEENNRGYFYDFTILPISIIIEYNGIHVHPNPFWPKEKWLKWKNIYNGKDADVSIEYDLSKKQTALDNGFEYFTYYSDQSLDKLQEIFNKCIEKYKNENKIN